MFLADRSHGSAHPYTGLGSASRVSSQTYKAQVSTAVLARVAGAVPALRHSAPPLASAPARTWIERVGECAPWVPMWPGRERWVTDLRRWADSPAFAHTAAVARVSIAAATLLAIAAAMATYADHATGRHVAVTRAKIAGQAGCSVDTVTVAWRLLRVAGWAIEARRGHGSPDTPAVGRRPSVYHLVPRREPQPVHNPDLPAKPGSCLLTPVGSNSPSAPLARAGDSKSKPRPPYRAEPRPLAVQRLAGQLVANSHGLGHGHIGAVCDALTAAGIDPGQWSARAIKDALEADMKRRGWSWPDQISRPAAFLASRLRRLDWKRAEGPVCGVPSAPAARTAAPAAPQRPAATAEQRARHMDRIRGVLGTCSAGRFGSAGSRAGLGEPEATELRNGEPSACADGPVSGGIRPSFSVGVSTELGGPVVVMFEPIEGVVCVAAQAVEQRGDVVVVAAGRSGS